MYSFKERDAFFKSIISKVEDSSNIIGTYLIGSSSIGFNDIYSDLDFMMVYDDKADVEEIEREIISFFPCEDIGYIMKRKWSDRIWGVSLYMKNGLSTDISFGPLEELKIKSPQIKVGVDTEGRLQKHLEIGMDIFREKYSNYKIDDNIMWRFYYLIRKYLIAIKRSNYLYAYYMLNDARMIVMDLEGLNEGMKMHEFKAYNELDKKFLKEIEDTIPKNISALELERCKVKILDLFLLVIENSSFNKVDDNLKYLLEIAD